MTQASRMTNAQRIASMLDDPQRAALVDADNAVDCDPLIAEALYRFGCIAENSASAALTPFGEEVKTEIV